MRVQFLVDYRGKLTGENYYTAGAVAEFEPAIAQALIDEGRAVAFAEPEPPAITPALPAKPKRSKPSSDGGVL
jgi:hypothetical protein